MDKLEQLLARIGTDDAPTDTELADALTELKELLRATVGVEKPTAEDIEAGTAIRQAMDKIDTEVAARADAEARPRNFLRRSPPTTTPTTTNPTMRLSMSLSRRLWLRRSRSLRRSPPHSVTPGHGCRRIRCLTHPRT